MQTHRRSFLTGATLGLGTLVVPAWIKAGFAAPQDDADLAREERLGAAWKRAKAGGRPLLILVVPEDDQQGRLNGEAWGEFLNHGAAEHLALIPLAELTCASLREVERVLGRELRAAEQSLPLLEPSAVLIESSTKQLRVVTLAAEPLSYQLLEGDYAAKSAALRRRIDERIARTGQALEDLLWPDEATLARRLHEESSAARIDTTEIADATLAYLAPAALLYRVREDPERLELAYKRLARRTANQIEEPVDGTRWGHSAGCGLRVEGLPEIGRGIACGMAWYSRKSSRFLLLYTAY